jgi:hypothetical protein
MLKNYEKSCDSCKKVKKADRKLEDGEIVDQSTTFGDTQSVDGADGKRTLELIESTIAYMKSDDVQTLPKDYRDSCRNKHELCSFWAVIGK